MQGRLGPEGPVALISLPCPVLAVTARILPGPGLSLHGSGQRLATAEQARRLRAQLGGGAAGRRGWIGDGPFMPTNMPRHAPHALRGRIILRADMPAGGGAGGSTAALVALALLAGWRGAPQALASACLAVEGATDPLMFARPERMLWASRRAKTLATLPELPPFQVVGGFLGPPLRTRPEDEAFPDISDLIPAWAAAAGDLPALARLAAISAGRTLAMRGGDAAMMQALARQTGALGWLIAHTGAARGLIFAPGCAPPDTAARLRAAGLRGILSFIAGGG